VFFVAAGNPSVEGSLDIEYLMSVGANIPTTYWYTTGNRPYPGGTNEPFLTWLTALTSSGDQLPNVISASYADEEYVIDPDFLAKCDVEFQKLAVRGTSLFFGSGDDGVTGDHGNCPVSLAALISACKQIEWIRKAVFWIDCFIFFYGFVRTIGLFLGGLLLPFTSRVSAPLTQ